jgi:hypothetical protein
MNTGNKTQSEDKQSTAIIDNPETQGTLGTRHKAKTNKAQKSKTIQRHNEHWEQYTKRRQTKHRNQRQSRDTRNTGNKTQSEDKQSTEIKDKPETQGTLGTRHKAIIYFDFCALFVFALCLGPSVPCVSGLSLISVLCLSSLCVLFPVFLVRTFQYR